MSLRTCATVRVCCPQNFHSSTRQALLLVLIGLAILSLSNTRHPAAASPEQAQQPSLLVPGKSMSQEILPGSSQTFKVTLQDGEYLRLSLKKNDLRLLVTVQDPGGKPALCFLAPVTSRWKFSKLQRTREPHIVSIRSLENQVGHISTNCLLHVPRAVTTAEFTHEMAHKTANEAEVARMEWQESTLRKAIGKYFEASQPGNRYPTITRPPRARKCGEIYSILSEYDSASSYLREALALNQQRRRSIRRDQIP